MARTIENRHLWMSTLHDAPPHWAVVTVKCCVVGILALPASTLLWLVASSFWPAQAEAIAPAACVVSVALGLAMAACACILTDRYPPVRPTTKR